MKQTPDWWAITERVANRPKPARPAPATRGARPAVARPATAAEFGQLLDRITEQVQRLTPITEVAPAVSAPILESAPSVDAKPLHDMSTDEFREHARGVIHAARGAAVEAAVDKAVREALRRVGQVTEAAPASGTPIVASAPVVETKPLHEMTQQEFREHARQTWQQVGESLHSPLWTDRQPLTLTEFLARGR